MKTLVMMTLIAMVGHADAQWKFHEMVNTEFDDANLSTFNADGEGQNAAGVVRAHHCRPDLISIVVAVDELDQQGPMPTTMLYRIDDGTVHNVRLTNAFRETKKRNVFTVVTNEPAFVKALLTAHWLRIRLNAPEPTIDVDFPLAQDDQPVLADVVTLHACPTAK
jgi:hypothetical protein